jgi:hypothetical protein
MTGQLGLEDEPREGETGQGEEGLEAGGWGRGERGGGGEVSGHGQVKPRDRPVRVFELPSKQLVLWGLAAPARPAY